MDSYVLTGPQGSAFNLGSWIVADTGADFGEDNLWQSHYSQTPAVDGGVYGYEYAGVRTMRFPLLLPSAAAFGGLNQLAGMLRGVARPNSTLDIQIDGVASTEAIRFDVLSGRVLPAYNQRLYAQGDRMPVTVELDTQPYGYWPTSIILASVGALPLPGMLSIPQASIVGDAPGLAFLKLRPSCGSAIPGTAGGNWLTDAVMWSLAGQPSHIGAWSGASAFNLYPDVINGTALTVGDAYAVGSQARSIVFTGASQIASSFQRFVRVNLPDRGYRGSFRLWGYWRLGPSMGLPWRVTADVVDEPLEAVALAALASAAPVATLPPEVASAANGVGAFGALPSPAYQLIDHGIITMPVQAPSAAATTTGGYSVRFWLSGTVAVPTVTLNFGGMWLQPVDGDAGVMPRGFGVPTISASPCVADNFFILDTAGQGAYLKRSTDAILNVARYHIGVLAPHVGASTVHLDVNAAARKNAAATAPLVHTGGAAADVSFAYQPRFRFIKGI